MTGSAIGGSSRHCGDPIRTNRALGQTGLGVKHHAVLIKKLRDAQTVAATAGAGGVVEREKSGFQLVDRVAAARAGVARGKECFLTVALHGGNGRDAVG